MHSIPEKVNGKLTAALLKEQQCPQGSSTSTFSLPQPQGGHPLEVTVGHIPEESEFNALVKHLYYCHSPLQFLAAVDRERGREGVEQITLVQGDTGQGFLKLAVSRIRVEELERTSYTRVIAPGVVYQETEPGVREAKKRTTREEGMSGGDQLGNFLF